MNLLNQLKIIQESITYHGKTFPGYNKPIKSDRPEKKFMVLSKDKDGNIKLLHFGAKGMSDYTKHKDEKRRDNFRARHGCDKPGVKFNSARNWSCEHSW
jgi:hypothetical protein